MLTRPSRPVCRSLAVNVNGYHPIYSIASARVFPDLGQNVSQGSPVVDLKWQHPLWFTPQKMRRVDKDRKAFSKMIRC